MKYQADMMISHGVPKIVAQEEITQPRVFIVFESSAILKYFQNLTDVNFLQM